MLEHLMALSPGIPPILDFDFVNSVVRTIAGPPGAPASGSFHQATAVMNKLMYSFGGYSATGKATAFRYNPGGGSTSLAALPTTIYGGLVVVHNGKFYNFGGTRGDASTDFIIYDPVANTYTREAAPGLPAGMHTVVGYANGKIYMPQCDGTSNYYIYDIASKTVESFSLTASGISAIFERATIVVDNYAYSFGGRATRAAGAANSNAAYRMNLTTKVVEVLANLPTTSFVGNNLFTNGRKIYVVAPTQGSTTPINTAMSLDIATLSWVSNTTPAGLRGFGASCYVSNRIYILGGLFGGTERTDGVSYSI